MGRRDLEVQLVKSMKLYIKEFENAAPDAMYRAVLRRGIVAELSIIQDYTKPK